MAHTWLGTYAQRVYTGHNPPLWVDKGISLCRSGGGVYAERMILTDTDVANSTLVLRGGYIQAIADDIYTELVSAGYGSYVS